VKVTVVDDDIAFSNSPDMTTQTIHDGSDRATSVEDESLDAEVALSEPRTLEVLEDSVDEVEEEAPRKRNEA
jgi:hypothetical protein